MLPGKDFFLLVPLARHVSVILMNFPQEICQHRFLLRSRKGLHLLWFVVTLRLHVAPALLFICRFLIVLVIIIEAVA